MYTDRPGLIACSVIYSACGSRLAPCMQWPVSRPASACPTRLTVPIPGHLFPGLATRAHVWHARSNAPAGSAYVVILSRSARVYAYARAYMTCRYLKLHTLLVRVPVNMHLCFRFTASNLATANAYATGHV